MNLPQAPDVRALSTEEVKALWAEHTDPESPLRRALQTIGLMRVALSYAETERMDAVRALRDLYAVPAVSMAVGGKHTENCECPWCEARAIVADNFA